ncbi:hypothetical protein QN277_005566 [Acacia crassicarpa]|uniref:Uncharacterized protein n=1 Tax=Acacia crassicarpa TaxID=499986 RepID=A0AAE1IWK4_9FABA|nr:hypothetical protein QN277_005566 [Acacia crassicarpa]
MEHEIITEKFAEYFSSKFGPSPSAAIVIIILTVIIGSVFVYVLLVKGEWRSKEKRMLLSSKSLAVLYGGDLVWRRLKDHKAALAIIPRSSDQITDLKSLLEVDEQHLDLLNIQRVVEKTGRDEGLRILKSAHVQHSDKSFFLHEIELALVELLIYQGNPEEALKYECLDYQRNQFDARPPLFKAIIHGMLGKWEEAANYWDDFVDVRDSLISIVGEGTLPAGRLRRISDFKNFKQRVQNLENEITKTKQQ